jgi:Fic family protein
LEKALATADERRDLTEWLEYFVQGIAVEMVRLEQRIAALEQIVHRVTASETTVMGLNPRQIRSLEFLLHEPRLTTELYTQWNRASRATAQRDLADLVARGLLRQHGLGRGTYYALPSADEAQTAGGEA